MRYIAATLLSGCAIVPLIMWSPPMRSATIPFGHQGRSPPVAQAVPVAAVIVVPVVQQPREVHSVKWFLDHRPALAERYGWCRQHPSQVPVPETECRTVMQAQHEASADATLAELAKLAGH
jgi:hypothetical protein